jgi:hypothetical protein
MQLNKKARSNVFAAGFFVWARAVLDALGSLSGLGVPAQLGLSRYCR